MKRKYTVTILVEAPEIGMNAKREMVGDMETDDNINGVGVVLDRFAEMPDRAHRADAGADLYSREDAWILPFGSRVFDTGVHMQIPEGYVGELQPKSGLNVKRNLVGWGTIDSGYTGSIRVKLYNLGWKPQKIRRGDKISQIVMYPVSLCGFEQVDSLCDTERGDGGFGSTGR